VMQGVWVGAAVKIGSDEQERPPILGTARGRQWYTFTEAIHIKNLVERLELLSAKPNIIGCLRSKRKAEPCESLLLRQKRNTLCLVDKGCFFSTKSVLSDGINPAFVGWNHFVMKSDFVGR
jgi:hypothetical protein